MIPGRSAKGKTWLLVAAMLATVAWPRISTATISFVKTIASTTSTATGTSQTLTVPASGVDVGATIIVSLAMSGTAGAVGATDTAGNTYTVRSDVTNASNVRSVVLSAIGVNRLVSGNTIVVTMPSVNRRALIAAEFWGVASFDQAVSATGNSTTPSSGLTAEEINDKLLIGSIAVNGINGDGFTPGSGYTLINRNVAGTAVPAATNNFEYQITEGDAAFYEANGTIGTTRQWAAGLAVFNEDFNCGNGTIDSGEDCDLGSDNGIATSCCNANCRFQPSNTTCRASAGGCDPAEVCGGASDTCPGDDIRPDGFVCRAASGECDVAELCDGVDVACPSDEVEDDLTPCTDDGTSCTIDICNGVSKACQHPADTGSPCVKFIQTIGTSSSTTASTTTSVTVPAAGVANGGSIILTVGLPSNALGTTGDVSATDTAGNVYDVDADVTNPANSRIVVLSSHKVTALAQGNTITVTHPSTNRRNLVAAEYSGLAESPNVDQSATNVGTENNANPATTGTTATTTQADQLLVGAFGVSGPGNDNFTVGAGYALAGRLAASNTAPTVTNIQEYRVVNSIGEYSAGFTTTTATVRQYAGAIVTYKADTNCGNGTLEAGEECDLGFAVNGTPSVCCTRNCSFRAPTQVCRAANGVCDAPDTCSGSSDTCPPDAVRPDGFVCRAIAGECDVAAETCDGVVKTCPADEVRPFGYPCTPDAVICSADICNGVSTACTHPAGNAGAECRAAVGSCDVPEFCTGASTTCPANGLKAAGEVCRPPTDDCDAPELCTGSSNSCGPDGVLAAGTECREANGICDVADTCTGSSKVCPDQVAGTSVPCRAATDLCDAVDMCDGVNKDCGPDGVEPLGTLCRTNSDHCDAVDTCDGVSKVCADGIVLPAGTVCSGPTDVCDLPDECDGTGTSCPPSGPRDSSFVCRPATGSCDVAEHCDGTEITCPADEVQPAGTECRAVASDCDVAEFCDGVVGGCADDGFKPDGTLCDGSDPNACKNACLIGQCEPLTPVTSIACCGNGILDDGEQCDDGNQVSGDLCASLPGDNCVFSTSATLIRGTRRAPTRAKSACQVGWSVFNLSAPNDKFGLRPSQQTCRDQDPNCDLDPTKGRCRFGVAICLNNADPNLTACTPKGIGLVDVLPPKRQRDPVAASLAASNTFKIRQAVQRLLDPENASLGYVHAPPLTEEQQNFCSEVVLIDVLAGYPVKRFQFETRVRSLDREGRRNLSTLSLGCTLAAP